MSTRFYLAACLLFALFASTDKSLAGGFDRFDQGIDLLFDPGKVAVDAAVIYGAPTRRFVSVNGAPEVVQFGVDKLLPSISLKVTPFDDTACLAHYRQPFGVDVDYGPNWSQVRTSVKSDLNVEEYGLTCSYSIQAAPGNFRIIGGVTRDFGAYHQEALATLSNKSVITPAVDVDAWTTGWRGGFAYEVPQKAIRASVMYYSPLDFSATGTFYQLPTGGSSFLAAVPVHAAASMPQTVEAYLQFPLAPAWVNTAYLKWADWSIWTRVPVVLSEDSGPLAAGKELSVLNFYFRDGWTISDQISHVLTKELTVFFRATWDRGVATGWDEYTDTWGGRVGAKYSINKNVELNGLVGVNVFTAGQIDKGSYTATLPTDTGFVTRIGIRSRL